MTRPTDYQLIDAVTLREPQGASSSQVAQDLGIEKRVASRYLASLYWNTKLTRTRVKRSGENGVMWEFVYRLPPTQAPDTQWQPPARIAQTMIREDA